MHLISLVALTGLVLLGTFATAWNPALDKAWRDWKMTHNKDYYLKGEEERRRAIWEDNLRVIAKHNSEASQGKHTHRLGINQFSDLTQEEFEKRLKGCLSEPSREHEGNETFFEESLNLKIPRSLDWRRKGYVTPVKNQEYPNRCGSCWAFSAAGALEALNARRTKRLVPLSVQNLVDCSGSQGSHGCQGGLPREAFQYVGENKGIASWASYPYTGKVGKCRYRASIRAGTCKGYRRIRRNDEVALQRAVARFGPVSVGLDVSLLHHYRSGIFGNPNCGRKVTHSALVVGYGEERGVPYWIIKNSWGTTWGVGGYLYLLRGKNTCAVAQQASFPV